GAKLPPKGGRRAEVLGSNDLPMLERIISMAAHAGLAAALAAAKEIMPDGALANCARQFNSGARGAEPLRLETHGEGHGEEYTVYVESARETPLARLIETERGRMMLLDSLLGALGTLFDE